MDRTEVNDKKDNNTRKLLTNALREYIKAAGGSKFLPYGNITEKKLLESGEVKTLRKRTQKALKIAPFFDAGREAIRLLDRLYSFSDLFDSEKILNPGEETEGAYDEPEQGKGLIDKIKGVFKSKILNEAYAKLKLPNPKSFKDLKIGDCKTTKGEEAENVVSAYKSVQESAVELVGASGPERSDENGGRNTRTQLLETFKNAIVALGEKITTLRSKQIKALGDRKQSIKTANEFYSAIKLGYEKYKKSQTQSDENQKSKPQVDSLPKDNDRDKQEKEATGTFQGVEIDVVKKFIHDFSGNSGYENLEEIKAALEKAGNIIK